MATRQSCQLLAVAEEGFDVPARAFPKHNRRQILMEGIGEDEVQLPVTVSGHDQAQISVSGHVDLHRCCPQSEPGAPFEIEQGHDVEQSHLLMAIHDPMVGLAFADPDDAEIVQPFGEPTCGIPTVEDDVGEWNVRTGYAWKDTDGTSLALAFGSFVFVNIILPHDVLHPFVEYSKCVTTVLQ